MHVFYTPEHGFSYIRETLLADKVLKAYFDLKGEQGLYYLFAFGHPLSPLASEINLKERDKLVNAEIIQKRVGAKTPVERLKGLTNEYQSPDYEPALKAALNLRCTPDITRLSYLRDRLAKVMVKMVDMENQTVTPTAKAGATNTAKLEKENESIGTILQAQYEKWVKLIREEEGYIASRVESSGLISLDHFIQEQ